MMSISWIKMCVSTVIENTLNDNRTQHSPRMSISLGIAGRVCPIDTHVAQQRGYWEQMHNAIVICNALS